MMGIGHARSGAAVWLSGCVAAQACGWQPDVATVVVGGLVCAGWALAPDMDHPNSSVARSLGPVTKLLAWGVGAFGAWVHRRTKTRWDRADLDGHRTVTHTVVWAVVWGLLAFAAQRWWPAWVASALVFFAVHLGVKTALPPKWRSRWVRTGFRSIRRVRVSAPMLFALGSAYMAYQLTPQSGWWLGLAVAVGSFTHCLGDCVTNSACPMLWPIPIGPAGRRRRWYPVGPPPRLRFSAGDQVERLLVQRFLALQVAVAGCILGWPVVQPTFAWLVQVLESAGGPGGT